MITIAELRSKWDELPICKNGFIRIDEQHPLEVYIGYEEVNQKTLMVIDTDEIADLPSSRSIIAKNFQRPDGRWVITFRLLHLENEDEFMMLCWDMIEVSRPTCHGAMVSLLKRYRNWQRLLERQRPDILDSITQKGLLGELLYLQELFDIFDRCTAVDSWIGPDGADQDFVFEDTWAEIKSLGISAEVIPIYSLEQLDCRLPGELVVFYLDKTSEADTTAFSLVDKINEIRVDLSNCPGVCEKFEMKLFQYGYRDLNEYTETRFRKGGKRIFRVTKNFPRLTKFNVETAVVTAKYSISLAAIASFERMEAVH